MAAKQIEYEQKVVNALHYLQQGVDLTIFPNVMLATTLKEAWKILESKFKGSNKVNKVISIKLQSLWRNFDTLTRGKENPSKHSSFVSLVSQIKLEIMGIR